MVPKPNKPSMRLRKIVSSIAGSFTLSVRALSSDHDPGAIIGARVDIACNQWRADELGQRGNSNRYSQFERMVRAKP